MCQCHAPENCLQVRDVKIPTRKRVSGVEREGGSDAERQSRTPEQEVTIKQHQEPEEQWPEPQRQERVGYRCPHPPPPPPPPLSPRHHLVAARLGEVSEFEGTPRVPFTGENACATTHQRQRYALHHAREGRRYGSPSPGCGLGIARQCVTCVVRRT